MNVLTKAYDKEGKLIKPTRLSKFYNRYDGYVVDYVEVNGVIENPSQAQEMIDFFYILKESLR